MLQKFKPRNFKSIELNVCETYVASFNFVILPHKVLKSSSLAWSASETNFNYSKIQTQLEDHLYLKGIAARACG